MPQKGSSIPSAALLWTDAAETTLLATLCDQVDIGKRSENGYKKEAWDAVVRALSVEGFTCTNDQAKNKNNGLKSRYRTWTELSTQSGFGWNDETERFEASEEVWDEYCKVGVSSVYLKGLFTDSESPRGLLAQTPYPPQSRPSREAERWPYGYRKGLCRHRRLSRSS